MGKKAKLGKSRQDIYYKRAKEAGYRSRAAYKLLQLNKKYNFLQTSRVCIDLCAAPGSWMQVAKKFMPVSSVIIGVDLHQISTIPNTLSIQGDITTESLRHDLKKSLASWKADVVLHDGAPNVGQNWLHDAYQQNLLVLHSFKLACEFLQKGGNFITKVFRSKDHLSLQYVFKKLFKRVEATKPMASRFESAEMFIVCLGFLAPDKIDQKFFDPQFVFQSLEEEPKNKIDILKPEKKRKPMGYEEGITMLFKKVKISEFIKTSNYMDILEEANEFEWDLDFARESSHTTSEILEICKDIKVLGRKDIRALISWRKLVKADIEAAGKHEKKRRVEAAAAEEAGKDEGEDDDDLKELQAIQEQLDKFKTEKAQEAKRERKRLEKKRKRLQEKLKLQLAVPGDPGPTESGNDNLFGLKSLSSANTVEDVADTSMDVLAESDESDQETKKKSKYEYYDKSSNPLPEWDESEQESEDDSFSEDEGLNLRKEEEREKKRKKVRFADQDEDEEEEEEDPAEDASHPLITDLVGDNTENKKERKMESWFSNDMFDNMEEKDDIEEYEIQSLLKKGQDKPPKVKSTKKLQSKKKEVESPKNVSQVADAPESGSEEEKDSGMDTDDDNDSDEDEDTPKKSKKKKNIGLTPTELALATRMIRSKKSMRDICDDGWNRYMTGDENVPSWFANDELQYNNPGVAVNVEDLKMYEDRNNPADTKTIKKAVEAKARKQRRAKKRLAKARKKATEITANDDMSAREKAQELQKVYKRATSTKKKDKTYVVMKKSFGGRKPKGVKGPSRMVDRRQKHEKRVLAKREKRKGKKKSKRK